MLKKGFTGILTVVLVLRRAIQRTGNITAIPILGGLHHEYLRI